MFRYAAPALAAPLFVLALCAPSGALAQTTSGASGLHLDFLAQVDDATPEGDEAGEAAEPEPEADVAPEPQAPSPREVAEETNAADYASQMRMRADLMPVHRAFGIATWISMLATVTLGMFQYYNIYGFFGGAQDSGCVRGDAIFGQDQCWGDPWVHRTAWITTTALYATTFSLSLAMPDPDHLDQGDSAYASNLRLHKILRWGHFAGMLAQVVLGLVISQAQPWFGLDRANDFGTLQALATVHQVVGLATFGMVTAAGAIMLF
ncbi:MAG: hypothetical protein H6719_32565 [Sandaracinaceae bacterium]|nr:hypothetical protein [Sandaracinaceae bacterium]